MMYISYILLSLSAIVFGQCSDNRVLVNAKTAHTTQPIHLKSAYAYAHRRLQAEKFDKAVVVEVSDNNFNRLPKELIEKFVEDSNVEDSNKDALRGTLLEALDNFIEDDEESRHNVYQELLENVSDYMVDQIEYNLGVMGHMSLPMEYIKSDAEDEIMVKDIRFSLARLDLGEEESDVVINAIKMMRFKATLIANMVESGFNGIMYLINVRFISVDKDENVNYKEIELGNKLLEFALSHIKDFVSTSKDSDELKSKIEKLMQVWFGVMINTNMFAWTSDTFKPESSDISAIQFMANYFNNILLEVDPVDNSITFGNVNVDEGFDKEKVEKLIGEKALDMMTPHIKKDNQVDFDILKEDNRYMDLGGNMFLRVDRKGGEDLESLLQDRRLQEDETMGITDNYGHWYPTTGVNNLRFMGESDITKLIAENNDLSDIYEPYLSFLRALVKYMRAHLNIAQIKATYTAEDPIETDHPLKELCINYHDNLQKNDTSILEANDVIMPCLSVKEFMSYLNSLGNSIFDLLDDDHQNMMRDVLSVVTSNQLDELVAEGLNLKANSCFDFYTLLDDKLVHDNDAVLEDLNQQTETMIDSDEQTNDAEQVVVIPKYMSVLADNALDSMDMEGDARAVAKDTMIHNYYTLSRKIIPAFTRAILYETKTLDNLVQSHEPMTINENEKIYNLKPMELLHVYFTTVLKIHEHISRL